MGGDGLVAQSAPAGADRPVTPVSPATPSPVAGVCGSSAPIPVSRLPAPAAELRSGLPFPATHQSPFAPLLGPVGWPRGSLLELRTPGVGGGGLSLILAILRELIPHRAAWGGTASQPAHGRFAGRLGGGATGVVLIDTEHQLYAPALVAWGLSPESTVVVRPRNPADALWACEQALRSRGVAAVWCHNTGWTPRQFRRLHLAARTGHGMGLITSFSSLHNASPPSAQHRWLVTPIAPASSLAERGIPYPPPSSNCGDNEWWAFRQSRPTPGECTMGELAIEDFPGGALPGEALSGADLQEIDAEQAVVAGGARFPVLARRWRVEQVHPRASAGAGLVELECSYETGLVRLVSPLAAPAVATRAARP